MQPLAVDALDGDVEVVGQPGGQAAVEPHPPQLLQSGPELVAQDPKPSGPVGPVGLGQHQRLPQPHDQGHSQGAGPPPVLLAAAVQLGRQA